MLDFNKNKKIKLSLMLFFSSLYFLVSMIKRVRISKIFQNYYTLLFLNITLSFLFYDNMTFTNICQKLSENELTWFRPDRNDSELNRVLNFSYKSNFSLFLSCLLLVFTKSMTLYNFNNFSNPKEIFSSITSSSSNSFVIM